MNSLVRMCAGRPVAVFMALAAILLAGAASASRLPISRLPEIEVPRVIVEADMPGLPASDIRTLVAVPLEDALAAAKGLIRMASMSKDGHAIITLDFAWGENATRAAVRVREIIDTAFLSLPEGASKPCVLTYDPDAEPLMTLTIAHSGGDLAFARRFAEREAKARLRRVEGAGQVLVAGGFELEVAVSVDMRKAAVRGLTVYDVARAIASENADAPAGSIREGRVESVAVARGRATDVEELAGIVLAGAVGPFRLSDLAEVSERNAPRKSLFVANGEERVAIELYTRSGADPVATARSAREVVERMSEEFRRDLKIDIVDDSSLPIAASIGNLAFAGAAGALIAAAVLFALLGDVKAAALVASSIPVSAAATLASLSALGKSLNGMSMGGIALAIGMISDNAVVVLDSLSSRCSSLPARPSPDAVAEATTSVVGGTFGSMLTTAIVFIPVLFLPGALGAVFGDLAAAVIAANVAGWTIAVFALPSMYRLSWAPARARRAVRLEAAYRRALAFALRRPGLILAPTALLALAGVALTIARPVSFMPRGAASSLDVHAIFPAGTDPDGMATRAAGLTASLSSVPGVVGAYGRSGAEMDDFARRADLSMPPESLVVACPLDGEADAATVEQGLLGAAKQALPGVIVTVVAPGDPTARMLGLEGGTTLAVRAESAGELAERAETVEASIRSVAGTALRSIDRSPAGMTPRILLVPRRSESAKLGVSLADAARAIRAATAGASAAAMAGIGGETPIVVFAAGAGSADGAGSVPEAMMVPVSAERGSSIPASAVARFSMTEEPTAIARLDRADVVYLKAVPAAGREQDVEKALGRVVGRSPSASRSDESAFGLYGRAMAGSVLLVLVLLYLALGAQFESFRLPLQVMATIPLAMAGVGPALASTGIGLDSGSILGLVVLFGVVVNNAILLHEAGTARRESGCGRVAAAYAGASDRVRAVLATTLTTIAALLSLCLSPTGAEQKSMAVTMLGGVVASTVLTLFVSPVIFAGNRAGRAAWVRGGSSVSRHA